MFYKYFVFIVHVANLIVLPNILPSLLNPMSRFHHWIIFFLQWNQEICVRAVCFFSYNKSGWWFILPSSKKSITVVHLTIAWNIVPKTVLYEEWVIQRLFSPLMELKNPIW